MGAQHDHILSATARIFFPAHVAGQYIADFTGLDHTLHRLKRWRKSRQMSHLDKITSPFGQFNEFVCLNQRLRKRLFTKHMATMVQRKANLFDMFAWKS